MRRLALATQCHHNHYRHRLLRVYSCSHSHHVDDYYGEASKREPAPPECLMASSKSRGYQYHDAPRVIFIGFRLRLPLMGFAAMRCARYRRAGMRLASFIAAAAAWRLRRREISARASDALSPCRLMAIVAPAACRALPIPIRRRPRHSHSCRGAFAQGISLGLPCRNTPIPYSRRRRVLASSESTSILVISGLRSGVMPLERASLFILSPYRARG